MKLFTQNDKMTKSSDSNTVVYNFGIPALYSKATKTVTCRFAGKCKKGCYAQSGAYLWSNVKPAYEARMIATLDPDFVDLVTDALIKLQEKEIRRAKRLGLKPRNIVIRVHDAGDFYSLSYLDLWMAIFRKEAFQDIQFYAYTKAVTWFKGRVLPHNFAVIYSEGGKDDHMIDRDNDRHSRVFPDLKTLLAAGYVDTTKNDMNALGENHRVGLVYHGAKSKAWATA